MDRGQKGTNQTKPGFSSVIFVRLLSVDSLATPGGGARYQPPASSAIIAVPRIRCCFFSSLSPSLLPPYSYSPSPDSDTLDFSRSRDLFEESRESFDASAYDGREFPFGGRTIPVKNCSRNAEAVIPAIFLFRSLLFLAPTRPRESACMYNVYIFFQRVELYRAKTRLVIAKVIHPIPNLRERVILMNHRIEVVWKGWVNIYEQGGSEFHAKSTAINTIPSLPGTKVSLNLLFGPN